MQSKDYKFKARLLLGVWGSPGKASWNLSWNWGLYLHKCHKIEWRSVWYDLRKTFSNTKGENVKSKRKNVHVSHGAYEQAWYLLTVYNSATNCTINNCIVVFGLPSQRNLTLFNNKKPLQVGVSRVMPYKAFPFFWPSVQDTQSCCIFN